MKRISTVSPFDAKMGFRPAVEKTDRCYVWGVIGYDTKTMAAAGLIRPDMKVEIELTAFKG